MILTCDRRYNTFDLKKNNKTLDWRSHFWNIQKLEKSLKIRKVVKKKIFKQTFFITKISKTFDFFGHVFLGAFIWNHPHSINHFMQSICDTRQSITNFRFFSCGGQNNFTSCHSFFMGLVRNLQKKWKKCPKSIQFWLCIRYCTDRLTLRHVQLFDRFLEVKLKHLEAR